MYPLNVRNETYATELLASTVCTATSTGTTAVKLRDAPNGYVFVCDVTAAATVAADTIDVYIQTKIGDFWVDVTHFTQMVGDGGAKRYFLKVAAALAQAQFENGAALAAAAIRNLIGDEWRVRYVVVSDTGPSFTLSVVALAM